jgi:hypothetical protein
MTISLTAVLAGLQSVLTWHGLLVFLISIVVDVFWGLYIRRSGSGYAGQAAHYAVLIMLIGAVNVTGYMENRWLLAPIAVGNWIGTFGIIRWDRRHKAA